MKLCKISIVFVNFSIEQYWKIKNELKFTKYNTMTWLSSFIKENS